MYIEIETRLRGMDFPPAQTTQQTRTRDEARPEDSYIEF
jgi:hypothetical protein